MPELYQGRTAAVCPPRRPATNSAFGLLLNVLRRRFLEQPDPRADEVAVVAVSVAAHEVAVDHTRTVDKDAGSHLEIEPAFPRCNRVATGKERENRKKEPAPFLCGCKFSHVGASFQPVGASFQLAHAFDKMKSCRHKETRETRVVTIRPEKLGAPDRTVAVARGFDLGLLKAGLAGS